MQTPSQNRFTTVRHAAEAVCFYVVVALIALAIGFVLAVLVLTKPIRSSLVFVPLPAVAWDMSR